MENATQSSVIHAWAEFTAGNQTRRYDIRPVAKPRKNQPPFKLTYFPNRPGASEQSIKERDKSMRRYHKWNGTRNIWLKHVNGLELEVVDKSEILTKIIQCWVEKPRSGNAMYDDLKKSYAGIPVSYCLKAVEIFKKSGFAPGQYSRTYYPDQPFLICSQITMASTLVVREDPHSAIQ